MGPWVRVPSCTRSSARLLWTVAGALPRQRECVSPGPSPQPHPALMIRAPQAVSLPWVNPQNTWSLGYNETPPGRLWPFALLVSGEPRRFPFCRHPTNRPIPCPGCFICRVFLNSVLFPPGPLPRPWPEPLSSLACVDSADSQLTLLLVYLDNIASALSF